MPADSKRALGAIAAFASIGPLRYGTTISIKQACKVKWQLQTGADGTCPLLYASILFWGENGRSVIWGESAIAIEDLRNLRHRVA
jgi:hypothetical protein